LILCKSQFFSVDKYLFNSYRRDGNDPVLGENIDLEISQLQLLLGNEDFSRILYQI
jgi:hypothetical protein